MSKLSKPTSNFVFKHVSVEIMYKTILQLKNSNCLDVYGISSYILKYSASFICEPLTHIFNCCLDTAIFPAALKFSKVIPIFKKGNNLEFTNYRPISIIPTVSKVFEILLKNQITAYFEHNYLFSNRQFGFRAKHSTINAVISLVKHCLDELENGKLVHNRFYDLTRAFDTVPHDVLIQKRSFYGFNDISKNLMKSYLNHRYQSVLYNNSMSKYMLINTVSRKVLFLGHCCLLFM